MIGGREVDFHWPGTALVVESDGYEFHRTRSAFERDRARDRELTLAGYVVVRVTARQVAADPAGVARDLRRLLRRPGPRRR